MCGISGFNWKDEGRVRTMVSALAHRGPDADGVFVEEGVSLGHNRLAIIDLSPEANQPMWDAQKEIVIVYNGEIYNFQELKKELEGEYPFSTKSDTEVILAGYRKWGKGVAERLNGMFAFAIWDRRDSSLFCARDHAGMKPFYYFWDGQKFIFASDIKTILTHPIPRALNRQAFGQYLRVLYTPEPMTLIENVFKLPPNHTLTLRDGILSIEPYAQAPSTLWTGSYTEAALKLQEEVVAAVERHLIADVPLGVYLSGGIDSSVVLAAMAKLRTNIKTFSIGFELREGEETAKFNSDFELAKRTARYFGTDHHPLIVSSRDVLESFEEVAAHNSDPISNPTASAMFLLAKFARKEVTVALTGNAGDEFFGGYERYKIALAAELYSKLPRALRAVGNFHPKIRKLQFQDEIDLFARFMFQKDKALSRIIAPAFFTEDRETKDYFKKRYFSTGTGDPAERFMAVDQKSWLPDYFFMLSDKMSMASALEERMPLADLELKAFARSLPRKYKVDLFRTKKILKDAFKKDLPPYLFNQPKRGWFSPAAKWLRRPEFARFAREVLAADYYEGTRELFNWPAVGDMLERHIDKKEYNLTFLWAIIAFQTWARAYRVQV